VRLEKSLSNILGLNSKGMVYFNLCYRVLLVYLAESILTGRNVALIQ